MSSTNRQADRSKRSSEALLGAAAELIAESGLAGMTFAAVGERAGYSRGLVSARFGSKAGLVEALIRRVWGHLRGFEVVPMSGVSPALMSLLGLIDGISRAVDVEARDMRAMAALLFEAHSHDTELRTRIIEFSSGMRTEIGEVLERGVADGSVRPGVDPDREATLIVAALHGLYYQWLLGHDPAAEGYATLRDMIIERYATEAARTELT